MKTQLSKRLWGIFAFSPWLLFLCIVPFILPKSAEMHATAGTTNLNPIDIGFAIVGNLYVLFASFVLFYILTG